MDLSGDAREFYTVEISTDPQISDWEASFDEGTTWVEGEVVPDETIWWRWLVSGPEFVPPAGDTTVSTPVITQGLFDPVRTPLLRAIDNPEVVVRDGPKITITD